MCRLLHAALPLLLAVYAAHAASEPGQSGFSTMVVFGDTQDLVGSDELYASGAFEAMVDWVLAHREAEHVDFVLHVGDAILQGGGLPLDPECLDSAGRCDAQRSRPSSEGEPGLACPCVALDRTDEEWQRFNGQWRRFDRVIPYAVVDGNHDNLGADDSSQLDRPGFSQFYGESHYRSLSNSGLISSHRDAKGLSLAWKFKLGDREVLVIGAADNFSRDAFLWAERVLDENPGIPTIALTHRFFGGVPPDENQPRRAWMQLVARYPERFALAVCGHVSPGEIRFVDVDGNRILRVRSNWQGQRASQSFMNLLRFYRNADGSEDVEVLAFDPIRGAEELAKGLDLHPQLEGRTWFSRQPFSLDLECRRGGAVATPNPQEQSKGSRAR